MGNLPINGNLPIEAKGIPNIGWSNSQYRLQVLPVVGIAPVFALASIVCTYNYITVYGGHIWLHFIWLLVHCLLNSMNDIENKLMLEYYTIAFKNNVTFKILQALFWLNYSEVQAILFDFHQIYQTGTAYTYLFFQY